MNGNHETFLKNWDIYLDNVQTLIAKKTDHLIKENIFHNNENGSASKLTELAANLSNQLKSNEVSNTFFQKDQKTNPKIITLLNNELEFFNCLVQEIKSANNFDGDNQGKKVNFSLNAGKTIKDSIEKIFNLPVWLQNLFDILNELFGFLT